MIRIEENPSLFVYFLIQFSNWEVKAAKDFDMPNSFPFENKIIVGCSIFAFSLCFPKDKSNRCGQGEEVTVTVAAAAALAKATAEAMAEATAEAVADAAVTKAMAETMAEAWWRHRGGEGGGNSKGNGSGG